MPDSPATSVESAAPDGYMPSNAQGYFNLANPYVLQGSMGAYPFIPREIYSPFYAQSYMAHSPYGMGYGGPMPYFGGFDMGALYGPPPQYQMASFAPEMGFSPSYMAQAPVGMLDWMGDAHAPVDASYANSANLPQGAANNGQNISGASQNQASFPRPQISVPQVNPSKSGPISASQQLEPVTPAQISQSSEQASTSHPSVQVVVQPSQPFAPVQTQRPAASASAQSPALTQSQMPTGVMQTVPQMGQPYASGPMYPNPSGSFFSQQSQPFVFDEALCLDPDLATGGRVAGATFLGILSIPFSLFAPLGLLFSLAGLHLANSYINNGGGRGVGNLARFFNIVGLVLTIAVTAGVALYVGYAAGQDGFMLFGEDPIAYINNSEPMQFLYEQWNKLMELWPW